MLERIGKYHVIRAAGSGGFGTVYEGYDVELDRNVAIKICTGGEAQLERFRREARIVSQLKHRNVALVFDFGYDQNAKVHFLVEEFLSGVDLDRKFEDRDRLPPSLRLRYMMGIAHGLEFVHERGLIHRDLSPRNVRVLHDHTIKIMDFGLAKDAADSTLTMMGDNFGTIGYTAPEQVTGMSTVDHRTDIFSFGVIAYELLTFTNPFMADNMGAFLQKIHHHEPRRLEDLWPACPTELADAIHSCMAKDPGERTASCADVLPVLKTCLRYLRDHDVPAIFSPPEEAEDDFDNILDAIPPPPGAPPPLTDVRAGRRTGTVDSVKITSPLGEGAGTGVPRPMAPTSEPAEDVPSTLMTAAPTRSPRRPALPGYLLAVAALACAAVLAFVLMRPGPETDAAETPSAEPAPSAPAKAPDPPATQPKPRQESFKRFESLPAEGKFELALLNTGEARAPSIQLLAAFPDGLEELSHCYLLREPAWSYGAKVRLDCDGDTFHHVDTVDVRSGLRYTYRLQLADAAGKVLAESLPASVDAGD